MEAERKGNAIDVSWDVLDSKGTVTVLRATTNDFKEGDKDSYKTIGETKTSSGHFSIDISTIKSPFYKILIKAPNNWTNRWVVSK